MALGVVLERRDIDNPWQSVSWRAVAVIPGAPPVDGRRVLAEGSGWVRYHAATLTVELHRKGTEGYRYNLSTKVPAVFVLTRRHEDTEGEVEPCAATVCPNEAQDYLDAGDDIVDRVPMPEVVVAWVQDFVKTHHVDQPFKKRRKKKWFDAHDPAHGTSPAVRGKPHHD